MKTLSQSEINQNLDEIRKFNRYLKIQVAIGKITYYHKRSIYRNFCESLKDNFTMGQIERMERIIKFEINGG